MAKNSKKNTKEFEQEIETEINADSLQDSINSGTTEEPSNTNEPEGFTSDSNYKILSENIADFFDCGQIAMNVANQFCNDAIARSSNKFYQNMELASDLYTCSTLSDFAELKEKFVAINTPKTGGNNGEIMEQITYAQAQILATLDKGITKNAKYWLDNFVGGDAE